MFTRQSTASITILFFLLAILFGSCSAPRVTSSSQPISHSIWDSLLRKHVDNLGLVDYTGMAADSNLLRDYLDLVEQNAPNKKNWTEAEQMVYWINAYNAFTVKLIIDNYPVASIKDIKNGIPFVNTVWDIKFITIGGKEFDLNNIEHGILRKDFNDPRIHFALVCASLSCPKLQRFAYTAEKLDDQLEQAARAFINEPFRNDVHQNPIQLSKLLDWYWTDFRDTYEDRYQLIQQYADDPINTGHEIEFLEYDWNLNDQTPEKKSLLQGN